MKIALIIEYFPPFATGGSEWSTYYLGLDLAKIEENDVFVFTPNYDDREYEEIDNLKIVRFPFYKRLKKGSSLPSTYFFVNPLWNLWVGLQILRLVIKYKIDIIHISGKYSLIPTRLANIFLNKKILVTIRDYQVICNYGFCLFNKDKSCSFIEYFTKDFIFYIYNYTDKKVSSILINFFYAVLGRIVTKILKLSCKGMKVIALSKKQANILVINGFEDVGFIYNSIAFEDKEGIKKDKSIAYIGRLTLGKGVLLFTNIFEDFFNRFPDYHINFVGDGPLYKKIDQLRKRYPNINLYGQIDHKKVQEIIAKSQLTIVPSLWPEPFGRVALESLANGTPVIVTSRGGLPEIVKDGRWGYVTNPDEDSLLKNITQGIENNNKLVRNIINDYKLIKQKFGKSSALKYMDIYKSL